MKVSPLVKALGPLAVPLGRGLVAALSLAPVRKRYPLTTGVAIGVLTTVMALASYAPDPIAFESPSDAEFAATVDALLTTPVPAPAGTPTGCQ